MNNILRYGARLTEGLLHPLETWLHDMRVSMLRACGSERPFTKESYVWELTDGGSKADIRFVTESLSRYNAQMAGDSGYLPLHVFMRDHKRNIVGALLGTTLWGWFVIDIFWIDANLRGLGYGSKLLRLAEAEARDRGCHFAYLDTFSFQGATEFYRSKGFESFGALENFPDGNQRYFLLKDLTRTARDEEEAGDTLAHAA